MNGMAEGAKFTSTTQGHTHPSTPRVFITPGLPTEGMKRGDIWINANALALALKAAENTPEEQTAD